jgi:hypothetical protein
MIQIAMVRIRVAIFLFGWVNEIASISTIQTDCFFSFADGMLILLSMARQNDVAHGWMDLPFHNG